MQSHGIIFVLSLKNLSIFIKPGLQYGFDELDT